MKTNRTTRVISSTDGDLIFKLPRKWSELTTNEIRSVFRWMAITDKAQLLPVLFVRLTNARINRYTDKAVAISFLDQNGKTVSTWIDYTTFHNLSAILNFVFDPGAEPVRFPYLNGRTAVDASLHGVSFGDYIRLETLYQGYLQSQNSQALIRIAELLYKPGKKVKPITSLTQWQTLMIVMWVTQIKALFSTHFNHFFKPAASSEGETPDMIEIINNEIRALTGGDVSKEDEILAIDCWRALTELNFKAQEAEEYNRRMAKYKS